MTEWVQWRRRLRRPPKAFFMAPVMVVKTWVLRVGSWMMLLPGKLAGMVRPSGKMSWRASMSPLGS